MNKDYFGKDLTPLKNKKLFLFDMDGTIYLDGVLFEYVVELMQTIKNIGGRYVFITNNSSKSVDDYIARLESMGIPCDEDNFFTSTQASAVLLKDRFENGLIYVQATDSCRKELVKYGLNITDEYDENASAILVGFDSEITGEKMRKTSKMLTKLDVPYYATNPDWVCPVDFGYVPDCGSMCFGYEKATGKKPIFIGKPNPMMIELAMTKFGVSKEQTLVVGDRIYTDIASGYNANVDTIMVLSGEATMQDYNNSDIKPTYVLKNVSELYKTLKIK
ncbi:MAG: HAD-IIA family hydrolase [Clostridia bacterium]|nr:HAD-IIA family hydrolase [Clostridia bacterium]